MNNIISNENKNEQPVQNIELENNEDILDNIAESNTVIPEQSNQVNNDINTQNENNNQLENINMDPFATAETIVESPTNQNNNIENNNNNNNNNKLKNYIKKY